MSKKDTKQVGLDLVPTKEEAIAEIAEVEEDYVNYLDRLSPNKQLRIRNSVHSMSHGLHAVAPTMCLGPVKCVFVERCPIPERDETTGALVYGNDTDYPIGRECILEKFYMRQKIIEYMEHLNVDPKNPIEMSIVNELALLDLYKNRALMILGVGDRGGQGRDFMRVDIIGFNENGQAAEVAKLHPALEVLEKLERRRDKWLTNLMETRKAKADWAAKVGGVGNESRVLAEITKLREALGQLEVEEVELIAEDDEILLDD